VYTCISNWRWSDTFVRIHRRTIVRKVRESKPSAISAAVIPTGLQPLIRRAFGSYVQKRLSISARFPTNANTHYRKPYRFKLSFYELHFFRNAFDHPHGSSDKRLSYCFFSRLNYQMNVRELHTNESFHCFPTEVSRTLYFSVRYKRLRLNIYLSGSQMYIFSVSSRVMSTFVFEIVRSRSCPRYDGRTKRYSRSIETMFGSIAFNVIPNDSWPFLKGNEYDTCEKG